MFLRITCAICFLLRSFALRQKEARRRHYPRGLTAGLHAAAPLNKAGSLLSRFPSGHEVECRKGAEIDKYKKSAKAILSACLQYTMEKMLCQDRQKNEGYYAKNAFCEKMHPLPFPTRYGSLAAAIAAVR